MAKLGNDWLFIGLGIGALYLVYNLQKPVTTIGEQISDVTGAASNFGVDAINLLDRGLLGITNSQKAIANLLTKSAGQAQYNAQADQASTARIEATIKTSQITSSLKGGSNTSVGNWLVGKSTAPTNLGKATQTNQVNVGSKGNQAVVANNIQRLLKTGKV